MTLTKTARLLFAFAFVAIFGCFLFESESQAQYFRRPPGQELGRFLGLGYGNGYHCRTPGPHTDYYNPYSANNSYRVSRYQPAGHYNNYHTGYANFGGNEAIPHSVYTGTQNDGYSVFEGLPGNIVTPSFEPVNKQESQLGRDLEERNFEDELDLGGAEDDEAFRERLRNEQDSVIDRDQEESESGAFESLRENFENLDSEDVSFRDALTPSEEDQAAFFGSNFGGN